ncbi:MAG: hypothetical protein ACPIOQ_31725, partial [Promethearchaeia archaeon]
LSQKKNFTRAVIPLRLVSAEHRPVRIGSQTPASSLQHPPRGACDWSCVNRRRWLAFLRTWGQALLVVDARGGRQDASLRADVTEEHGNCLHSLWQLFSTQDA